jgi:CO/xanthine dehydrogenase Mo-binding subunit
VIRIDKYVSPHDAGRILNPALFDGQVHGGFAMAIGSALYERFVYAEDGGFLTGSTPNAVADALGVPEISLPLTPEHMLALLRRGSSAPTHRVSRR